MITAAVMYLDGYPADEIERKTGHTMRELLSSGAITPEMKERHKEMLRIRKEFAGAADEWDIIRKRLLTSGSDLSSIPIVLEGAKKEVHTEAPRLRGREGENSDV